MFLVPGFSAGTTKIASTSLIFIVKFDDSLAFSPFVVVSDFVRGRERFSALVWASSPPRRGVVSPGASKNQFLLSKSDDSFAFSPFVVTSDLVFFVFIFLHSGDRAIVAPPNHVHIVSGIALCNSQDLSVALVFCFVCHLFLSLTTWFRFP